MGIKTFVPRFSPIRRFSRGVVGDGFDPWKSVFEGPCGSHHQHHPGHDPGPDETVIELVARLRAQPFSKPRGRRGMRERSDATLLKEFGRQVRRPRPRALVSSETNPTRPEWTEYTVVPQSTFHTSVIRF